MKIRKSTGYGATAAALLATPLGWPMNTPIWHGVVTLVAIIILAAVAVHFRTRETSGEAVCRHLALIDLAAIVSILGSLIWSIPMIWNTSSRF